jgi:hypothetical protein
MDLVPTSSSGNSSLSSGVTHNTSDAGALELLWVATIVFSPHRARLIVFTQHNHRGYRADSNK